MGGAATTASAHNPSSEGTRRDGAGPTNHYAALLLGIQMGSESPEQPEFFTEQGSSVI